MIVSLQRDVILARLARSGALQRALGGWCAIGAVDLDLLWTDGVVGLHISGGDSAQVGVQESTAPVYRGREHLATLRVRGSTGQAPMIASAAADVVAGLLRSEDELESLTQEVVHVYEELHLLYDLGAGLGGVLHVDAVCGLIVQKILAPLGAQHASIRLSRGGQEEIVAEAEQTLEGGGNRAAESVALLQVNAEPIGRLVVTGKIGGHEFTSSDLKLLDGIAAVVSPAIENAQIYEHTQRLADHDPVTDLANHRRLQEQIVEELERARRYEHPLTLIMIDLDNFKLFNDVYGHPAGDYVLRTVGDCLQASIRASDTVGRYGGDEFMIILPETDSVQAVEAAERILAAVAGLEIRIDEQHLPIGLSLGIASYPKDATTKHQLIVHADTALYDSKTSGGGMVRVAESTLNDWSALQGTTFGVLEGLVQAVDAKDHYTREHSEVVTEAALLLAEQLQLSPDMYRALRIAGLLHDVGKIGIPDRVLKKPGKLTDDEYEMMKAHVKLSELMIKDVPQLGDVLDAVAHHHERFDGHGYPYQKQGEEIPLLGRIMAIADAYSAMCMDRPYRKGLSWAQVRAEMVRGCGTQFDPQLVPIFIAAMDQDNGCARQDVRVPTSVSATVLNRPRGAMEAVHVDA